MHIIKDRLFTPFSLGSLQLRNRSIRAAAFEGMCPGNNPSQALIDYHVQVAKGGVGMTTVAYAAVDKSGLSFPHQLLLRKEIVPELRRLTDAVHLEGAACSIQLGHCGNMASHALIGGRPLAPTGKLNLYGPTLPRKMKESDIQRVVSSFGEAVSIAIAAGFDAVEVHAGHGYLISQFLSPFTNQRKDKYGGSLDNRMRFMRLVMREVKKSAGNDIAVLVKINMQDGFKDGMKMSDSLEVARALEYEGVDALVLSGGFVSKSPMYILRGDMPIRVLTHYMKQPVMRLFTRLIGRQLIPSVDYSEAYFLEDALKFRSELKLPLVYVGGLISGEKINQVLGHGFELVAIARALIQDPDFINKLYSRKIQISGCDTCNYCIAKMYTEEVVCIQNESNQELQSLLKP